jgi:hypothetical protein
MIIVLFFYRQIDPCEGLKINKSIKIRCEMILYKDKNL